MLGTARHLGFTSNDGLWKVKTGLKQELQNFVLLMP